MLFTGADCMNVSNTSVGSVSNMNERSNKAEDNSCFQAVHILSSKIYLDTLFVLLAGEKLKVDTKGRWSLPI